MHFSLLNFLANSISSVVNIRHLPSGKNYIECRTNYLRDTPRFFFPLPYNCVVSSGINSYRILLLKVKNTQASTLFSQAKRNHEDINK